MQSINVLEKSLVNSCERLSNVNEKMSGVSPMLNSNDVMSCQQLIDKPPNHQCIDQFEREIFGSSRSQNTEEYDKIINDFDHRYSALINNVGKLNSDIVSDDNNFSENKTIYSERFNNSVNEGVKLLNDINDTSIQLMTKISNDYGDVESNQYKDLVNSYFNVSQNYEKIMNTSNQDLTAKKELENFKNRYEDISSYNTSLIIVLVVLIILTILLYFIFIRF